MCVALTSRAAAWVFRACTTNSATTKTTPKTDSTAMATPASSDASSFSRGDPPCHAAVVACAVVVDKPCVAALGNRHSADTISSARTLTHPRPPPPPFEFLAAARVFLRAILPLREGDSCGDRDRGPQPAMIGTWFSPQASWCGE